MLSEPWQQFLTNRQVELKKKQLWRYRQQVTTPQTPTISVINNDAQAQSVVNFSSNDYLGLANHPKVTAAMQQAVGEWGSGSGASHLVCGHQTPHHQLEAELANFVGAERALLFSTGYMANLAVPASLLSKHDLLLQDKLNHASLLDAARMTPALFKRYRHADVPHARAILQSTDCQKTLITTDGVFSMDGDIAPLAALKQAADKHNGLLLVDDAHGLGVLGECGRGSLECYKIMPTDNVLLMGTLGKAVGSFGAFVAGDELIIEQLLQTARSYIYTTALPPSVAIAAQQSLSIIQSSEGDDLRQKMRALIVQFSDGMAQLGLPLMASNSPIQPLLVGGEQAALELSDYLFSNGFYVTAIRPPTVPKGSARLRFTLSAAHSSQQVDALLACLDSARVREILS